MPRRKAADRVGPVKTRSRGGCKECRASRVRCDGLKPSCTRCKERGLTCSTELVLKWESEFTSRGLAFGRAGVWNKSRGTGDTQSGQSSRSSDSSSLADREWCFFPAIESWGFVNSGVSTFEQSGQPNISWDQLDTLVVHSPVFQRVEIEPFPALSPTLPLFPNLSQPQQQYLLDYYLDQVCPRTTASSTTSSPFASVILPFCLSASPTLFQAIQALGACHWSRSNPEYATLALKFKWQAIRGLRQRLSNAGSMSHLQDPEILVIMMMLCLYEIVDNCDQRWTVHLQGAKDLIRFKRQQQLLPSGATDATDAVSIFAERFFAFQDVMGRTACAKEKLFENDYWRENKGKIDLWMGCSPELVSLLSSITDLSRTRRQLTTDSDRAAFSLRAASLGRELENLVQETDSDADKSLWSAAELKRLAAVLYLHSALYGASPTTPLVVGYVRRILRIVSDLLESGSLASMTWPLFVAAVELDPVHDEVWGGMNGEDVVHGRPLILRALAAMADSSVSNIARSRAVIVKVWQARDNDMLKGSPVDTSGDPTSCNDWEWYIVPLSDAMSLA
ncbi:hypothetical protein FE257_011613 [Aspergillus nanangensis]|uniref:Zn(2)-C6 fungal-type domain-containing protein n=1 Tax=Aspergillus nanangensis TaxID=2582783 RepID=A0AAD4CUZ1_ASPNN|nr:hypothetical protein FE257_011613 [Aspergillus nanangensis]